MLDEGSQGECRFSFASARRIEDSPCRGVMFLQKMKLVHNGKLGPYNREIKPKLPAVSRPCVGALSYTASIGRDNRAFNRQSVSELSELLRGSEHGLMTLELHKHWPSEKLAFELGPIYELHNMGCPDFPKAFCSRIRGGPQASIGPMQSEKHLDTELLSCKSPDRTECEIRFTSRARRARVLRKLGVSADQVANAPKIMPLLKDNRGSLRAVLESMRFSQDPVVHCFLAKRDSLGVWARQNTCWEAIALAAGIDLLHLLGAALLARREHTVSAGKLVAMSHYPEVVKKRIEYAKLRGGWRDRDALDKLLGLL
jgi:hypothetical protein